MSIGNDRFAGIAGDAGWILRQRGDILDWQCSHSTVRGRSSASWLKDYLRLGDEINMWVKEFGSNPLMKDSLKELSGMYLIRQEPFECSISYLFAQGLSVKVIQHAVNKLCEKYGNAIQDLPKDFPASMACSFPSLEKLASLTPGRLKPYSNNYTARAERIIRLSRSIITGAFDFTALRKLSCDEARVELMTKEGVGPKIADCILLFSLDHLSAFPLDRWVYRAMRDHFGFHTRTGKDKDAPTPALYREMTAYARKEFGARCGVASEYLFLYLRSRSEA